MLATWYVPHRLEVSTPPPLINHQTESNIRLGANRSEMQTENAFMKCRLAASSSLVGFAPCRAR
jgi:hypothetical protein